MQISSLNISKNDLELDTVEDTNLDYDSNQKDIEEMKQEYIRIKELAIQDMATKKAEELFKLLPSNIQEFYKLMIEEYSNLPVFLRYDMDDLYTKLDLLPNYDLYNMTNMFQERYKDNKELFETEFKSLKRLSDIILVSNNLKQKTMKQVLLTNISKVILDFSHKYNVKK